MAEIKTSEPIWRDYWFNLGTEEIIPYKVRRGISIIYDGVAVLRPLEPDNLININDMVEATLFQKFPTNMGDDNLAGLYSNVSVAPSGKASLEQVFRYDWSYNENYNPLDHDEILCAPINGKVSPKQNLIFSTLGLNILTIANINVTEIDADGVETITSVHNNKGNVRLAIQPTTKTIRLSDKFTFQVTEGCEDFCIYYVNEYGGWDSLLLEGRGTKTDEYTRHSHKKEYNNANNIETSTTNYLTEINREWELHTGWLLGEEGKRMHHLLSSPLTYLHDLRDGSILPVMINNSKCIYKDYHNNGGQLVEYTLDVEVARDYKRQ